MAQEKPLLLFELDPEGGKARQDSGEGTNATDCDGRPKAHQKQACVDRMAHQPVRASLNQFVPLFIDLGVDVMNMQQSRNYGLVEFGRQFRGQVCFLATVDIQTTLPRGIEAEVHQRKARRVCGS